VGNPVPLQQSSITCNGHAFEARIYAENPRNDFLPDVGPLIHIKKPDLSPAVRIDEGFLQGQRFLISYCLELILAGSNIEIFYDPLISKLIVHGSDRSEALRLLRQALSQYEIAGLSTNIEFLRSLAEHPAFIDGDLETGFIAVSVVTKTRSSSLTCQSRNTKRCYFQRRQSPL
jgi:3-methylcrotonyl-CoA carboxylase alpha subunit